MPKERKKGRSVPERDNKKPQESPVYGVITMAFTYFDAVERGMDELSLINICMAANCPSREIALQVLAKMVAAGLLTVEIDPEFGRIYKPVKMGEGGDITITA